MLPCGSVFDVVNVPSIFGRRMLDRLWAEGPGSGPGRVHRGRMLLFAAPGTAQRLPSLLAWEEWHGADGRRSRRCSATAPATPSPSRPWPARSAENAAAARWLVAPDTRRPWLPGPDVLLGPASGRRKSEARGPSPDIDFSSAPIRMLMSTTSAGAASSVG